MKKLILALGLTTAIVSSAHAQAVRGVTATEIIIGMQTDLSGPVASWGVSSRNAAQLRFEEVNAKGGVFGRKITFIVEDSQYQVPRAVQAVNKLINRDNVFAMFGNLGTAHNNAVFEEQFAAKVPNLFPFSAARSMSMPIHPLKFASLATYYDEARSITGYFVKQGKTKICTMYQDSEFGQEIFEGVRDELTARNMKILETTTHKPIDTDFTAQISRLKAADCEVVVMGSIVRDAIVPYVTARRMGWNAEFATTTASFDFNVAGVPNGGTEGLYITSTVAPPYEDGNDAMKKFITDYKAKFNLPPSSSAMIGYIGADITVKALEKAGKDLTLDSFIKGLNSFKYTDDFGNPELTFTETKRQGTRASNLYQVKGGKFTLVSKNITDAK
jgi:branched-chain amino acid transport system substrate-binding protein